MHRSIRATALGVLLAMAAVVAPIASTSAGAAAGDTDATWATAGIRALPSFSELPDTGFTATCCATVVTNRDGRSAVIWTEVNADESYKQSAIAFLQADGTVDYSAPLPGGVRFHGSTGADAAGRFLVFAGAGIRRYQPNGTLDHTFGSDGVLAVSGHPAFLPSGRFVDLSPDDHVRVYSSSGVAGATADLSGQGFDALGGVGEDASGRIYVAGPLTADGGVHARIVRFDASTGTVDATYAPTFTFSDPVQGAVLGVDSTGAAFFATEFNGKGVHVARADGDGVVSSTFGGTGQVALPDDQLGSSLVDSKGDFVLATARPPANDVGALTRFTAAGLDPTFGTGGVVTESVTGLRGYESIAPMPDGGVLVASSDRTTTPDHVRVRKATQVLRTLPSAPSSVSIVSASAGSATISWPSSPAGSSPITGYRILVTIPPTPGSVTIDTNSTTRSFTVNGLGTGPAAFNVAAMTSEGVGPYSPYSPLVLPPFTSTSKFTTQQFQDFVGRAPSSAELSSWSSSFSANGPSAVVSRVVEASNSSFWAPKVDPVTRLYYAYFQRPPDTGGLGYWSGRLRNRTSVYVASSSFAGSSEFKATYGSLSNRAFVELVYQNVLGRPGEANGVDYWTSQIDLGKQARGKVMVGFSEASEHKRRRAGEVNVVDIVYGLLRRVPTAEELTEWAGNAATDKGVEVSAYLSSNEYDARV